MAKKNQQVASTEPSVAESELSPDPRPAAVSLEQKIANRLGHGVAIVDQMLKSADREGIEASIDSLSNEELAERLEQKKKS